MAGDGNSLSSYRITDSHPSGEGPVQSMQQALADASASPTDVDYVNAHGTSTMMNDRSEAAAMHAVFGADVQRVAVSSTKSVMGHLIAAPERWKRRSVRSQSITARCRSTPTWRAGCRVRARHRARRAARQRINVAISNSLGFGGSNSCLALRNPEAVDLSAGGRG
jgi:3-oxoacyl-(acyl-carrier-protein) synthase